MGGRHQLDRAAGESGNLDLSFPLDLCTCLKKKKITFPLVL